MTEDHSKTLLDPLTKAQLLDHLKKRRNLIEPVRFNMIYWLIRHRTFKIHMRMYQELLLYLIQCEAIKNTDYREEYIKEAFDHLTKLLTMDQVWLLSIFINKYR